MGDKALRGNKLTRIGFKQGGAYGPLRGTTAGGVAKAFRGKEGFKESQALQKKLLGQTKDTGLHKGSKRKATSPRTLGTPRPHKTKSDYSLEQAIKQTKKMPDKKFTHVDLQSINPGGPRAPVKGSVGKQNYIKALKYYHHRAQPKGKK